MSDQNGNAWINSNIGRKMSDARSLFQALTGDYYSCLMGGCLLDNLAYSMSGEHIMYVDGIAMFFNLIYTILCVWTCYCSSENPR